MVKIAQMIEIIKEDVNEEKSITLTIFNKMLQTNFKLLLLRRNPFSHLCVAVICDKLN